MKATTFDKKSLLKVGPPGFGWYKVAVHVQDPRVAEGVSKKNGDPWAQALVRFDCLERAIFEPGEDEETAVLLQTEEMNRSFFQRIFWGPGDMVPIARAFGKKLEATGRDGDDDPEYTDEDITRALDSEQDTRWVRVYHREEEGKDGRKYVHEIPAPRSWRDTCPDETFVHEDVREQFQAQS